MKQFKQGGQVANDILAQLGGANRLNLMTGAYNFVDLGNGLSFRIKNQRANFIKVTVSGLDLYDLEVGRIRGMDYKVVFEESGLYNDMLKPAIEKATGMTLTMPRIVGLNYEDGGEMLVDGDEKFRYMMLDRLQSDCDYYLGYGNRSEKQLWTGNVDEQIKQMKLLWNSFPEDKKPEWLTMEQILNYEKEMKDWYEKGGKLGDYDVEVQHMGYTIYKKKFADELSAISQIEKLLNKYNKKRNKHSVYAIYIKKDGVITSWLNLEKYKNFLNSNKKHFDEFAEGGNLDSLLKKQTQLDNKLTDIKLYADLHTEKGVEAYRAKMKPIHDKLKEIEKQLDEVGYEPYEGGGAIDRLNKVSDNREEMISFLSGKMGKSGMSDKQYDQLEKRLQNKSYIQLKKLYEQHGGKKEMAYGGSIPEQNKLMVKSQAKEIGHHVNELLDALEGNEEVPAWVVAKTATSASDLSDVTHFLEGIEKEYGVKATEDKVEPEYEEEREDEDIEREERHEDETEREDGDYGIDGFAKGGELGDFKISFQRKWHPIEGTVYKQSVRIDKRTYEKLKDAVDAEIAHGLPRKKEYVSTSGYEIFLKPLKNENGICYLNLTQTRFINLYLKLPLKDRNTLLTIVDKKEDGGDIDGFAAGGVIEVSNLRKNRMGTLSFDMKISGMRKSQDFIVYPVSEKSDSILIQSDTRIGRINMTNGKGIMSQSHANGAYGVHLSMDKLVPFELTESQLQDLKEKIGGTAGDSVGSRNVLSDNSFADKFAAGGEISEEGITKKQWYALGLTLESGVVGFSRKVKGGTNKAGDECTGEVIFEEKPMFFAKNWSPYGKFVYIDKEKDEDYTSHEVPSTLLGNKNKFAKGGSIPPIDMDMVEKSAIFYTDESKWSTKPTIKKFEDELVEYSDLKEKLENNEIKPYKIIGSGLKPQYARPLAFKWLNEHLLIAKRAIEILKERGEK